jgi:hypothetical protein
LRGQGRLPISNKYRSDLAAFNIIAQAVNARPIKSKYSCRRPMIRTLCQERSRLFARFSRMGFRNAEGEVLFCSVARMTSWLERSPITSGLVGCKKQSVIGTTNARISVAKLGSTVLIILKMRCRPFILESRDRSTRLTRSRS